MAKKKYTMELKADTEEQLNNMISALTHGVCYIAAWERLGKYLLSKAEFEKSVPAAELLNRMDKILEEEMDL